jgi:glycosyltransferase involved in cell wall biosynthesis
MSKSKPEHQSPYFSIVIPVFNRAATIGPTIESCLKQSFTDFEVVIVDDGSGDNLEGTINAYSDPRIRYVWRKNGGGSAARNTGIETARGKYIAFLDSDDFFLEDKLFKCHQFLENNDCECLYSKMYVDRGVGKYWVKPPRAIAPNEHMADYLLRDRGWIPTPTMVVKNTLAKKVLFKVGMPFGQDMDFAIRLYNSGAKFHMLEEPLVICMDLYDPTRVSFSKNYDALDKWTEEMRDKIPPKAYYGNQGWRLAKTLVDRSYFKALSYYANALFRGSYGPKMAIIIFCQIFFPIRIYRTVTDTIAALFSTIKIENKDQGAVQHY